MAAAVDIVGLLERLIRARTPSPGGDEMGLATLLEEELSAHRPDEIARGVTFLCDPASEYITGTTLRIDGGVTLVRGRPAPVKLPTNG